MQATSDFDQLEPVQKADALRFAGKDVASQLDSTPKCAALVFFDQLVSDVEAGRDSTPLTHEEFTTRITTRFPGETTAAAVTKAPYRLADFLEEYVCPYPEKQPKWELRFKGPTLSSRKGSRARSSELYLTYTAEPVRPENTLPVISAESPPSSATPFVEDPPATDIQNRDVSSSRLKLILPGTVLLAFFLALAFVTLDRPKSKVPAATPPSPQPQSLARRSIAVLSFRSALPEDAWIGTAISELLSRAVGAGHLFRTVPAEEVFKLERDLALLRSEIISPETLERIRMRVRADFLVIGSYDIRRSTGPFQVDIRLRLVDTTNGRVLLARSATGAETRLAEIAIELATPLRKTLGIDDLSPANEEEVKVYLPSGHEPLRLYLEGSTQLRLFHTKQARDLLLQAAAADANHPLIQSALFNASDALGFEGQAREALKRARHAITLPPYSDHFPSSKKQEIEAQFHAYETRFRTTDEERGNDWQRAIDAERSLWQSSGRDEIEYGLRVAEKQITAARVNDALITVATLRQLPPPLSADGRIDLAESRAHQEKGDADAQLRFATAAADKARKVRDLELLGDAQMLRSTALLHFREAPAAYLAIDEARDCFQSIGDLGRDARAVEHLATAAGTRGGDLEREQNLLREALSVHRRLGDQASIARVALRMSNKYVRDGNDVEARRSFDEAIATFQKTGNPYRIGTTLNEEGAFLFDRGELRAAEDRYAKALEFFQTISDSPNIAISRTNIGEVLACRGDLGGALELHRQSLAINEGAPGRRADRSGMAYDLCRIADILALQGNRPAAWKKYNEALEIQEDRAHPEPLEAAKTRIALARLLIDDGNALEAAKMADEAHNILSEGGEADHSISALSVLTQALLAQGNRQRALETANQAWKAVAMSKDRRLRFMVAVPRAHALAASNNVDAALKFLEGLRTEAARTDYVVAELQIRLAMGQIEVAAGRPSGLDRLAAVEQVAKTKRIGDIVRRAAAERLPRPNRERDRSRVTQSTAPPG